MKHWRVTSITIFGLLASVQAVCTESPSGPEYEDAALWGSKYVTEGRDNLDGAGIFSLEGAVEWRGLNAGAWVAAADDEPYEELNLFINYGAELGPVYTYAGYTRLEFPDDDEGDNEISVGMELKGIGYFMPAVDYRYSTEADGGFLELSINSEIVLLNGRLLLGPYIMEGLDFGYASQQHDGPNNFQIGIDFTWALTGGLSLVGSVAHSRAQADVRNDGLGDVSWLVIGVAAEL